MQKALELAKKATVADNAENYDEAINLYSHAVDYFLHDLKCEVLFLVCAVACSEPWHVSDETHGERAKGSIKRKCSQYLDRAEQLKRHLSSKTQPHGFTAGGDSSDEADSERDARRKQLQYGKRQ